MSNLKRAVIEDFSLGMTGADGFVGAYSGSVKMAAEGQPQATAADAVNVLSVGGSLVPLRHPNFASTYRSISGTGRGLHLNRAFSSAGVFKAGASGNIAISGFSDAPLVSGYPTSFELEDGSNLKVNFGIGPHGTDVAGGGFKGISTLSGIKPSNTYNAGSPLFTNGTTGADRSLCYSIVRKVLDSSGNLLYEFETNPCAVVTTTGSKGNDPGFVRLSADSPFIADLFPLAHTPNTATLWVYRIYSSVQGMTTGPKAKFFFLQDIAIPATGAAVIVTLNLSSTVDASRPLYWDYLGAEFNPMYREDHSGYLNLQRIGDGLHGYSQAGTFGGGCIVASNTNDLIVSSPGYPMYRQWAYTRKADSFIEMIKPSQRLTVISSLNSLYTLTGSRPADFSFDQIRGATPVKFDSGLAAQWTPFGLLYPSDKGICLFDGSSVSNIGSDRINRKQFEDFSRMTGVFIDSMYLCWDYTGNGYFVDFIKGPNQVPFIGRLDFSASAPLNTQFKGALVTPDYAGNRDTFGNPAFGSGMRAFVSYLRGGTSYVQSFSPRQNIGSGDDQVSSTWSYTSNRVFIEAPGALVRLERVGVDYEGAAPVLYLEAYDYSGTPVWSRNYLGDIRRRAVPKGTGVDYVKFRLSGYGTTVVHRIHFEYSVSGDIA